MSATSAAPAWLEYSAAGVEVGHETVSRLWGLADAVRVERRTMLFGDMSDASAIPVATVVARTPRSPSARAEFVGGMTTTELRTMLVEVVRELVSMRGRKNSKAQRASATVEVSEMDQAAARVAARRIGFIVHPGRGKGRR